MDRVSREDLFTDLVGLMSKRSTCNRHQVGCVIAKEGRIIATGYNGSPSGTPHCADEGCIIEPETGRCIRTVHAEAGAISFAAKHGISLDGTNLYVSISPCLDCAKLIINAGIKRVYFLEEYRKPDGVLLLKWAGVMTVKLEGHGGGLYGRD